MCYINLPIKRIIDAYKSRYRTQKDASMPFGCVFIIVSSMTSIFIRNIFCFLKLSRPTARQLLFKNNSCSILMIYTFCASSSSFIVLLRSTALAFSSCHCHSLLITAYQQTLITATTHCVHVVPGGSAAASSQNPRTTTKLYHRSTVYQRICWWLYGVKTSAQRNETETKHFQNCF